MEGRALRLAGIAAQFTPDRAAATVPALWSRMMAISTLPDQISEVGYGVRERRGRGSDTSIAYTAAVEVASHHRHAEGVHRIDLPPARYLVIEGFEHIAQLRELWGRLEQAGPPDGLQHAATPSFERFGERFDPVGGRGPMAIWLAVLTG
ncbi:GyrI-like domain-containing protein [Sphingomonas baiyangensis]|uniref:GyrI-like domain-containing protein n=1 Tax=Sphingomonas baiyangensis TaxID=2572576 RepID=UPI00146B2F61|nr:GyrI-like domain-containing protein [Sphingomonas baiyangensis]